MKKLIALCVAVVMLLFGFAATAKVDVAERELTVCEDIKPSGNPREISNSQI